MIKLFKNIAQTFGFVHESDAKEFLKSIGYEDRPKQRSSTIIGLPIPPDLKEEQYLRSYRGWVYACVRAIAQETANIDLTLYRRTKQNQFEIVDSHPVLDLLYKVNPMYTSYLLWEATEAYQELTGEVFWWLAGGTPKNPKEIWVLRPDWVRIRDTKNAIVEAYEYGPNPSESIVIKQEEIIHFKHFNPIDAYRGFGPVKAGAKAIDTDEFASDYNRNFFYNSALPGGALQTENNLTDEQYERVRNDWNAVHKGKDKAWKIAILEAGLKWEAVGVTQKDMDFLEGRKLSRDEILSIFQVPKPIVAIQDDVNRAAAREARAVFLENNITHKMKRLASFLNEFLLPRYGDETLFFDFKNPVPNDETAQLNYYRTALGNAPFLTINEVREMEDRDPIEGGDTLMMPFSLAPIGENSRDQAAVQQENFKKRKSILFNTRQAPYPYFRFQLDQANRKLETLFAKTLNFIVRRAKTVKEERQSKAVEGEIVNEEAREIRWRQLVNRTDPSEVKMVRLLNDLFTAQEDEVKKRLDTEEFKRAMKAVNSDPKKVKSLFDITDLTNSNGVFVETLMKFLETVIETEGIATIQSLIPTAVFFMQVDEIKKYIQKDGAKYITAINEETSNLLRNTLSDGIQAGDGIPQLKKRVEDVYIDAMGYRAERIARSEVLRAANFGTLEAYKQSGVVEEKEWLTAKDERTCPWCNQKDGKRLSLDDPFAEKGDVLVGKTEAGKNVRLTIGIGDINMPPLHPNCRCTLIPVLADDKDKSAPVDKSKLLGDLVNATVKEVSEKLKNN